MYKRPKGSNPISKKNKSMMSGNMKKQNPKKMTSKRMADMGARRVTRKIQKKAMGVKASY